MCLYGHDIDTTTSPIEAQTRVDDRQAPTRGGRLPRRRAHPGRAARRLRTTAGRHSPGGPDARPRGCGDPKGRPHGRPGHQRRLRAHDRCAGGAGLCGARPCRAGNADRAHRSWQAHSGLHRLPSVRPAPLPPLKGKPTMALYYTKDHEWVRVDGDVATIGISDHAQEQLGDVVFVELPDIGKQVKQGEEAAVVESVKAASEVYAPGQRRGRRGQLGPRRQALAGERGRGRCGLVLQDQARQPGRARRPDGPRRLRVLPRDPELTPGPIQLCPAGAFR